METSRFFLLILTAITPLMLYFFFKEVSNERNHDKLILYSVLKALTVGLTISLFCTYDFLEHTQAHNSGHRWLTYFSGIVLGTAILAAAALKHANSEKSSEQLKETEPA